MKRQLQILAGGGGLAWLVLAYPALWQGGPRGLVYSLVSACLCLLPTALTLLWSTWAVHSSPDQQLVAVLGGTGLRMAVVLGGALSLYYGVAYFAQESFLFWLLVFYLLTLALEIGLVLRGRPTAATQPLQNR